MVIMVAWILEHSILDEDLEFSKWKGGKHYVSNLRKRFDKIFFIFFMTYLPSALWSVL